MVFSREEFYRVYGELLILGEISNSPRTGSMPSVSHAFGILSNDRALPLAIA